MTSIQSQKQTKNKHVKQKGLSVKAEPHINQNPVETEHTYCSFKYKPFWFPVADHFTIILPKNGNRTLLTVPSSGVRSDKPFWSPVADHFTVTLPKNPCFLMTLISTVLSRPSSSVTNTSRELWKEMLISNCWLIYIIDIRIKIVICEPHINSYKGIS